MKEKKGEKEDVYRVGPLCGGGVRSKVLSGSAEKSNLDMVIVIC